jgi:drug/metabolite transporter (DMT)-like permease
MALPNPRLGIKLMIAATFVFAMQDGISRHLAGEYNVFMVVMVRYWFFAAFVIFWAKASVGSIRKAAQTKQPVLQGFRGVLLVCEICVMILGFVYIGLIESLAIFTIYPLIIAALSGPILGETVGWRRWLAICAGFVGILIILQPGLAVFSIYAIFPLCSAIMFALYGLLTRYASRQDSAATSFFWTGVPGSIAMTMVGVFYWEPMISRDQGWMALLCVLGVLGHFLLIKCYEVAEASGVQPFAYLHLVFGSALAMVVFGESLKTTTAIGAGIVIAAGLYTLWRERQVKTA